MTQLPQVPTPPWLNEDYLQNILQPYLNLADIKILNYNAAPLSSHREGFLSLLLRISTTYEANSKVSTFPMILKCENETNFLSGEDPSSDLILETKEMKFFDLIAEKMIKISNLSFNDSKLIPDVIFIDKSREILMIEDLKLINFTSANRVLGIDEKEAKISLQKIAKFHAAGLKIFNEDPKAFDEFNVGVFNRNATHINEAFESGYKGVLDEISTWEGFEEIYHKMENLSETFMERTLKCFDVDENDFNMLNHGDVWTTNFMFKYEDGEVVDAVILDFQFAHYASITLDLIRFFYSSLNDEIFKPEKIQEFIPFYYNELKNNLEKLELEVEKFPTLEEFLIEYNKKMFYAFTFLTNAFPVMLSADPEMSISLIMSNTEEGNALSKRVLKEPRYRLACERFLPYFNGLGLLD